MSGIAGIINWNREPATASLVEEMLNAIRHRGPQGLNLKVKDRIGFGHAFLRLREEDELQPLCSLDKSLWIVADARLYNRKSILEKLGPVEWKSEHPSDAALILACYERWQENLLDFLEGDFAFAIWDSKRDRLFASRDHFGNKPFFYSSTANGFAFGSEPKQLLLCPGVSTEPDDVIVGEYLFNNFEEKERTFHKDIKRLKPSHFLIAEHGEIKQTRYWSPNPEKQIYYPKHQDYIERFRELLKDAVEKRLKIDRPVMAHLSGGMDSSSIVVLAADIYAKTEESLPTLETISATYEDLACDELPYITAVSARVPFRSNKFCPLSEPLVEGLKEELRRLDSPYGDTQRGTFDMCAHIIAEKGAGALLTGLGGDEVTHEDQYLRDLVSRRKYLTMLRDSWRGSKRSYNSFFKLFSHSLRVLAPEPIKKIYRAAFAKKWQPPDWAEPDFVKYFLGCREIETASPQSFCSLTQQIVYQHLTNPTMVWVLEALECKGSYSGYEVRHPFVDLPLVEYVLAIPFEQRVTGGKWKYLLHAGLASDLPSEVLNRARKTHFQSYVNHIFFRDIRFLKDLVFNSDNWESKKYVIKEKALRLFEEFDKFNSPDWPEIIPIWAVATLELWLKDCLRYH